MLVLVLLLLLLLLFLLLLSLFIVFFLFFVVVVVVVFLVLVEADDDDDPHDDDDDDNDDDDAADDDDADDDDDAAPTLHLLACWPAVGRQPLKFGSAGSPRVACPTSVPERLELYGEARPKPPTLRRRAPKNAKNPSGGWGRAFWTESGSLISVSKSIILPPPDFEGT